MMLGPMDLVNDLAAPETVYSSDALTITASSGASGTLYEILPNGAITVADLCEGLAHIPQGAQLRNAFTDEGEICISVWS